MKKILPIIFALFLSGCAGLMGGATFTNADGETMGAGCKPVPNVGTVCDVMLPDGSKGQIWYDPAGKEMPAPKPE